MSHIWFTIADKEDITPEEDCAADVLGRRDRTPSVEAPIGDFFGLGLGDYFLYQSAPLAVGADNALNCFFPMPFRKHARITVTNEGSKRIDAFYCNIDCRTSHLRFRRTRSIFTLSSAGNANVRRSGCEDTNLDGKNNYVWMEAQRTRTLCRRDHVGG